MKEAVEFSKANRPEMYAAIAKYTKLPPAVVSSLAPPNLEVDTSPQQVKFWIDLAKEQGAIKGQSGPGEDYLQAVVCKRCVVSPTISIGETSTSPPPTALVRSL